MTALALLAATASASSLILAVVLADASPILLLPAAGIAPALWVIDRSAHRMRLVAEALSATQSAIAVYDANDRFVFGNRRYITDLSLENHPPQPGEPYRTVIARSLAAHLDPSEIGAEVERRLRLHRLADGVPTDRRYPGGLWLRVTKTRLASGSIVGVAVDVTDYYAVKSRLACEASRFSALAENAPVGICQVGEDGTVTYVNRAMLEILGLSATADALSSTTAFTVNDETLIGLSALLTCLADAPKAVDVRIDRSPPLYLIANRTSVAARGGEGPDANAAHGPSGDTLFLFTDITARKEAEARVARLAMHDVLTGAKNRMAFNSDLAAVVARASEREPAALVAIDLDRFKPVNDRYGHAVGDALLRAFVARVNEALPDRMTLYRVGGDEFAILASGAPIDDLIAFCKALLQRIAAPFDLRGVSVTIGASIGVSALPKDTRCADTLVDYADRALYHVKRTGRSNVYAFHPQLLQPDPGEPERAQPSANDPGPGDAVAGPVGRSRAAAAPPVD